jgi:hypothetical protein
MTGRGLAVAAAGCALIACGMHVDNGVTSTAALADGTYHVAFGSGYAPADEPAVLAVTAQLRRAEGRLVFTMRDGSQRTMVFSPRPLERWQPDCFTMGNHVLDEVADLSPAPLHVESLTFATPLVFAKCGPRRMILADAPDGAGPAWLAFDLQ